MDTNSISAKIVDRRKRRKIIFSLLLLTIIVFLIFIPGLCTEAVWDGYFQLALNLSSKSGESISDVSYATFFKIEEAEWLEKHTDVGMEADFHPAEKDNGWYIATVLCSGRFGIFNMETKYIEPRYIVVRLKYKNGKELRRMV